MRKHHRTMIIAAALLAPFAGAASAASVHSAAGVLPPLPQAADTRTSPARQVAATAPPLASRFTAPTSPPPLPGSQARSNTAQSIAAVTTSSAGAAPRPSVQRQTTSTPPPAPTAAARKFDAFDVALKQSVTIDVMDMRFEDLLEKLTPNGWRMRAQNIDPATLDQRVDLTAQATRGEVLHELLAQSNLTAKPFSGFDVPLLIITNH